ncbi:MAG: S1 RNA-binding domain-containing protein, partial [Clostridia bacterium]|nr:S1 RNA-binding domain-containing protein [Clostridia bacterium]
IGVHHDGLLHISEMSDRYIKHPSDLFSVGDVIEVRIKDVDIEAEITCAVADMIPGRDSIENACFLPADI